MGPPGIRLSVPSEAAAQEIIRLFSESADDRVRYMAAQWTYEQAWGKARDFDPNAEREPSPLDFSRLTAEQRQQVRAALELLATTVAPHNGEVESPDQPVTETEPSVIIYGDDA